MLLYVSFCFYIFQHVTCNLNLFFNFLELITLIRDKKIAIEDDLKQGRLIEVLQQYARAQRPFSLLYPKIKYEQRHIRLFIDFLVEHLSTST